MAVSLVAMVRFSAAISKSFAAMAAAAAIFGDLGTKGGDLGLQRGGLSSGLDELHVLRGDGGRGNIFLHDAYLGVLGGARRTDEREDWGGARHSGLGGGRQGNTRPRSDGSRNDGVRDDVCHR